MQRGTNPTVAEALVLFFASPNPTPPTLLNLLAGWTTHEAVRTLKLKFTLVKHRLKVLEQQAMCRTYPTYPANLTQDQCGYRCSYAK